MKRNKELSEHEVQIFDCLAALGLSDITVPYTLNGASLIMENGRQIDRRECSITKLYQDCLKHLYSYTQRDFSPGIYAFYGGAIIPKKGEKYADYLYEQIKSLHPQVARLSVPDLASLVMKVFCCLERNLDNLYSLISGIDSFELLHGDLHIGNVLEYMGNYRLIDFEFVRFGAKSCEIAFFVCWEYIVGLRDCSDISSIDEDLSALLKISAITYNEATLVKQIFIPLFIILAAISADNLIYHDSAEVSDAVKIFAMKYLQQIL